MKSLRFEVGDVVRATCGSVFRRRWERPSLEPHLPGPAGKFGLLDQLHCFIGFAVNQKAAPEEENAVGGLVKVK